MRLIKATDVKKLAILLTIASLNAEMLSGQVPSCNSQSAEKTITLEEIFRLAEDNETRIQIGKSAAEIAEAKITESKRNRLPDISANVSASYIGNGWMSERNFSNGQNVPMPHFGNNFAIEATQIIYAGSALRTSTEIAEINKKIADNELQMTREQVRLLVAGHYLDLFRMNNQAIVYRNNAELMRQLVEIGLSREEQGTALRNDVTRYELQLAEMLLALDKVNTESSVLNYRLCTMLGIGTDTIIAPDTALLHKQLNVRDQEYWQTLGNSSAALSVASSAVELAEKDLKMAKSSRLPKLAVSIADRLDGPILIEVPTLNNNFNYWYAGIGITVDLGALYKSPSKIRQARTGLTKSRQQYKLACEETAMNIQAAYRRYLHTLTELETQTKNVELAGENYRIILNRYENGLSLVTDMIDAANMKLSAELAEVNARISIIYAWYELQYAAGTI